MNDSQNNIPFSKYEGLNFGVSMDVTTRTYQAVADLKFQINKEKNEHEN